MYINIYIYIYIQYYIKILGLGCVASCYTKWAKVFVHFDVMK